MLVSSGAQAREFHFLPPAPEETRAFVLQLLGSLAALVGLALVFWKLVELRPVSVGAALGLLLIVGRSAWSLELRARRSQLGGVTVDDAGVTWRDGRSEQVLGWAQIEICEVRGGKLHLSGVQKQVEVSAREVQDGMKMVEEISARWKNGGKRGFVAPSNFIPLAPK